MIILEMDKIAKSYSGGFWGRKREVLAELSLEIACGEVFGLLGHNGAGKTTTMRLILGLLKPDSGSIRLFGEAGAGRDARARIGYLGDELGLYTQFTAEETLQYMGELFRLKRTVIAERKAHLLKTVGLAPHAKIKVKQYSKGMRQRLGIALALLNDPELLILDEPYSGLDPIGRRQVRQLLLGLKEEGRTILLSSHIVPDVEAVCDRVGILRGGQIRKCLALKDIYVQKSAPVEITASGIDPKTFEGNRQIELIYDNGEATVLKCGGSDAVRNVIAKIYDLGGTVLEVKPLKFNLEDYLLEELGDGELLGAADEIPLSREEMDYAHTQ
jgi:ABC-2 type transport system ATP-binding protein